MQTKPHHGCKYDNEKMDKEAKVYGIQTQKKESHLVKQMNEHIQPTEAIGKKKFYFKTKKKVFE